MIIAPRAGALRKGRVLTLWEERSADSIHGVLVARPLTAQTRLGGQPVGEGDNDHGRRRPGCT